MTTCMFLILWKKGDKNGVKENFSSLSVVNILTVKRLWHREPAFKYFSLSHRDLEDKNTLNQQSAAVGKGFVE